MHKFADTHREPCKDRMSHKLMAQGVFLMQFDSSLTLWLLQYMVVYAKPPYSVMKCLRHCPEEEFWLFVCGEFTLQGWPVGRGAVEASPSPSAAHLSEANGANGLTCTQKAAEWETLDPCLQPAFPWCVKDESCKARSHQSTPKLYLSWRIEGDSCLFGMWIKRLATGTVQQHNTAWRRVLLCKD